MPAKMSFDEYLSKVPEEYRSGVDIVGSFSGKRTKIRFKYVDCCCEHILDLGSFVKNTRFDACKNCRGKPEFSKRQKQLYCKRCGDRIARKNLQQHEDDCKSRFDYLIEGEDYVVCTICGFHGKSIGVHLTRAHKVNVEEYKKNHPVICSKSSEIYSNQNKITGNWIKRAKDRGEDLSEYKKKMGEAVRNAIINNPEERKRRANVMAEVNRSDVMRKKSSETAIKTSARKDIQEKRAAQLQKWREENPNEFYEKCISKMLSSWSSKPENVLYELLKDHNIYKLKRHRKIRSYKFIAYKQRDVDVGDAKKGMYIEFDGPLHFKETSLNQLEEVKLKDKLLDEHINEHNLTLIRVSYDQFSYRKSDYGFKKECIDKIFQILDNPTPGVHKIGEAYNE